MTQPPLLNIRALVTRPQAQADELASSITRLGGMACALPMISIEPLPENQNLRSRILELDQYNKIIVTSHHAARYGLELIENYWPQPPLNIKWYAIGEKTRSSLADHDICAYCPEKPLDSETVLSLDDFDNVDGERVLLIKGSGGRELLYSELRYRGAAVDTLEVYERKPSEHSESSVQNTLKLHNINVILVSSGEILTHLAQYLCLELSKQCNLIVPSQRVKEIAQHMGFKNVYIAQGATDSAMISVLSLINSEGLL